MYSLALCGRPTRGEPFIRDITTVAKGWRRTTKAVGGYNLGSFAVESSEMTIARMERFFEENLGCVVQEYSGGQLSWEGIILEMRLMVDGVERMRTLDPEYTHNKVDIMCAYPPASGNEAGGPYHWDLDNPLDSFTDEAQDFSPWETSPPGTAAYRIRVVCTDGVVVWGFMGDAYTEFTTDDSIHVFEDIGLTDEGWAVENLDRVTRTPDTYTIEMTHQAVGANLLGWAENPDSVEEYGEIQYLEVTGNVPPDTAAMLQQKHLVEFAWPRSILVGGVTAGAGGQGRANRLVAVVMGFWPTCNWRYLTDSTEARGRTALEELVALTEFVTTGRMEHNYVATYLDCMIPQRLGDLMEEVVNLGDHSYNPWQAGVYEDRELIYEQAPNTVEYTFVNNMLLDKGGRRVLLPLVKPGFLVRMAGMWGGQPMGSTSVWDDRSVAYVDQVEFIAPGQLKLSTSRGELSITSLMEQLKQVEPEERWPETQPKPR